MKKYYYFVTIIISAIASMTLSTSTVLAAVGRTAGISSVTASGEASYSIPIFVPPGINGVAPRLALAYGHRQDESLAGVGWSVSGLSEVTRCAETVAQNGAPDGVTLTMDDRFCMDGNQLMLYTGNYGQSGTTYRTEVNMMARITSMGTAGNGPAWFKVESKDGLIYEYGNSSDSRIESLALGFESTARTWALSKIADRSGNEVKFYYIEDGEPFGSYRIDRIEYRVNPGAGLSQPGYRIKFTYEPHPPEDIDTEYGAGGLIEDKQRLIGIDVLNLTTGSYIRRYYLEYEPTVSSTGRSRLTSVEECSTGPTDCFPKTTFVYQNGTNGFETPITYSQSIPTGVTPIILDINGDGLSDVAWSSSATSGSGTWMYRLSNGSGFGDADDSSVTNTGFTKAFVMDYNQDGKDDLLVPYDGNTWWVLQGTSTGFQGQIDTQAPLPESQNTGGARGIDVNGDGREDLVWGEYFGNLYTDGDPEVFVRYREQSGGFSTTPVSLFSFSQGSGWRIVRMITAERGGRGVGHDINGDGYEDIVIRAKYKKPPPEKGFLHRAWVIHGGGAGNTYFDSKIGQLRSADFNGDGYRDLVYFDFGLKYRMSIGPEVASEQNGPPRSSGWVNSETIVVDWDSDGFDDILAPDSSTGTLHYFRSTGAGFDTQADSGISVSDPVNLRPGDVNGDGLSDVVYVQSDGTLAHALHAGVSPDLLTRATDGNGNYVEFAYAPMSDTTVYQPYSDAVFPDQDHTGSTHVVKTATYSNGVGGEYSISYSYAGAWLNLEGRGQSGFDRKTAVDSRSGNSEIEYFHRDFPYRGRLKQRELRLSDNTLVQQSTFTWDKLTVAASETTYFPHLKTTVEKNYEAEGALNGTQIDEVTTTVLVDTYGTPYEISRVSVEQTLANGIHPNATFNEKTTLSGITDNVTNWCLGKPTTVESKNSHTLTFGDGDLITRTTSLNWDTSANCRLNSVTVEPGSTEYELTTTLSYDSFGNVSGSTIAGSGIVSRSTSTGWGTTGQFPETVTNALGQVTNLGWNVNFGLQTSQTDPNGITVSRLYDGFGRLTRETRADGTYTDFTLTDCDAESCTSTYPQIKTQVRASSKATDATEIRFDDTYLDMADRVVQQERQAMGGGTSKVRTIYDEHGRIEQQSMPDFSANPSFYTTIEYDLIGRPTEISRPVDEGNPTLQQVFIAHEGLTTRVTDAEGKTSTRISDALGGISRSVDHSGYYQQFEYDAFGSVLRVTDGPSSINVLLENEYGYGIGAFREFSNDMDMGEWHYTLNALGEVVAFYDANTLLGPSPTIPTATFEYDKLGRLKERDEVEGTTFWTWGTSAVAYNIGRLASVSSPGHSEAYDYDSSARLVKRTITADTTYEIDYEYNSETGLLEFLRYPESTSGYRLPLKHDYQNGILQTVSQGSYVYWQANATDARGNNIDATLGNGIRTVRSFDAVTGWLSHIKSGIQTDTDRQNMEYLWDKVGNLKQRHDVIRWLTEDFIYDDLHRLDYSLLNQSENLDLSYDTMGNITSKSDVGGGAAWTYHATKKHAVTQAGPNSYSYDDNGNQKTRNGNNVYWTSYNYPEHIENGPEYHDFFYDANRQRWKRDYFDGSATESTIYVGGILEKKIYDGITEYRHYIYAGGEPLGVYIRRDDGSSNRHIFLKNHQGSIASVTWGGSGGISVNENFTAFGERRDPIDWDGPPSAANISKINQTSERGYTFHSNLEESSLIHMNGRVADGLTGRFLSPDPFIPDPGNTQAFNRYSYVYNNPLSYTDPSGFDPFCILECFILPSLFSLFGGGSSAPPPPPPPNFCHLAGPTGCYGSAPSNFERMNDDIFALPGQLFDIYTCTRIMNNPLSCLFGSPIGGGGGVPGLGGGGFGTCFLATCSGEWDGITLNFGEFDSVFDAAIDALGEHNQESGRINREIGGTIYRVVPNWFSRFFFGETIHFTYDKETLGEAAGRIRPDPSIGEIVAIWHTHGNDYENPGAYERFSGKVFGDSAPGDIESALTIGVDSYLGTPRGRILLFRPTKIRSRVGVTRRIVENAITVIGDEGTLPTWDGPPLQ